ncbi:MAG: pitrilysin family protein [Calditrichia bacterium]
MTSSEYNKTVLSNGLTVVSEKIPTVRSVTIGVWIKAGGRDEDSRVAGTAHFVEHMLFKGTKKRSARAIARSLESVGGYLNAFTTKEQTCYYAEILDTQLGLAVDVLADMVCNSTLLEKEIEKERDVILDEIDSVEDTPDDLVQDIFMEKLYPANGLGIPILGYRESVARIGRENLVAFFEKYYRAGNLVIAAAGNLDHSKLVNLCEKKFSLPEGPADNGGINPAEFGNGMFSYDRSVHQAHICLGTTALPYHHHRKFELLLLNTLLGAGMSSRLYQNIRERHGVAYSIYSFVDFFRDNGLFGIYLGTEKSKIRKALQLLEKEFDRLKQKTVSDKEMRELKMQVKGGLVLGLESTARRMNRLAKTEIYLQAFTDLDDVIKQIDQVTGEQMTALSEELIQPERMLQVMFVPANA